MTDRDALLAAVAARPGDDTPRLVFADWVDDHEAEASDLDRAARDFVRLHRPTSTRLTAAEGRWLEANWRRLVPGLRRNLRGAVRRGRFVCCTALRVSRERDTRRRLRHVREPVSFGLEFRRGFLAGVVAHDRWTLRQVARRVLPAQPAATFDLAAAPVVQTFFTKSGRMDFYRLSVSREDVGWKAFELLAGAAPRVVAVVRQPGAVVTLPTRDEFASWEGTKYRALKAHVVALRRAALTAVLNPGRGEGWA